MAFAAVGFVQLEVVLQRQVHHDRLDPVVGGREALRISQVTDGDFGTPAGELLRPLSVPGENAHCATRLE